MSFTSDEVNYLIYRYLKEAGFEHSAFTFGCESAVTPEHCHVNPSQVLPGTLIGLLQKGLQFIQLEVEACSPNEDEENGGVESVSLLTPYEYGRKRKAQEQNIDRKTKRTKTSSGSGSGTGRRAVRDSKPNNSSKEDKTPKG